MKKLFLHSPKHYAAAVIMGAAATTAMLFSHGHNYVLQIIDAVSVAGALVLFFGLLMLVSWLGAFDGFGYSFSYIFGKSRYKDMYEYTTAKTEKRKHEKLFFMPYILVGLALLAASGIIYVVAM